jgi:lipoprotein-anchoring transpeptidase ErfK/SrfK
MTNKKSIGSISVILTISLLFTFPLLSFGKEDIGNAVYAEQGRDKLSINQEKSRTASVTTPPAVVVPTPVHINTAASAPMKRQSYNGKRKRPNVLLTIGGKRLVRGTDYKLSYRNNKNPGVATIKVRGIGKYTGIRYVKFRIGINTPKRFKVKVNGNSVQASWVRMAAVTGYKVYFASNRKFTNKKQTKTVKSRKKNSVGVTRSVYKRTYYVKIRAYKKIKGKTYYGKISKIKKVKAKAKKWIIVDLSQQKTYLKKGKKKVKTYIVSTGKKATPTVQGTFYIYKKNPKHDMVGQIDPETGEPEYIQEDVLWATYFIGGYAFHATYWHNNFGTPMSHGCVNMKTNQAKYLYKWAPMGTKVVVRK